MAGLRLAVKGLLTGHEKLRGSLERCDRPGTVRPASERLRKTWEGNGFERRVSAGLEKNGKGYSKGSRNTRKESCLCGMDNGFNHGTGVALEFCAARVPSINTF